MGSDHCRRGRVVEVHRNVSVWQTITLARVTPLIPQVVALSPRRSRSLFLGNTSSRGEAMKTLSVQLLPSGMEYGVWSVCSSREAPKPHYSEVWGRRIA